MALPLYMLLLSKSNNKYMTYIHEDGDRHGFLQFSDVDVASPYAKFEIEPAKTKRAYVHIRCCYNNRYLVRKSEQDNVIMARAKTPEEDDSKWSCTLFEPIVLPTTVTSSNGHAAGPITTAAQFVHVQLNLPLRLNKSDSNFLYAAKKSEGETDTSSEFVAVNWESLVILPRYVTFNNGKAYLKVVYNKDYHLQALRYESGEIGESAVAYEVFTNVDGSVRIKSKMAGKFWKVDSESGLVETTADEQKSAEEKLCWFWPVKLIESNAVALRCVGNGKFCGFSDVDDVKNCLDAKLRSISSKAHILVGEPVMSRKIYNVNFRLLDARIYNESIISKASGMVCNATETANNATVKLSYVDAKSSTWTKGGSLTLGVRSTLEAGIPVFLEGKLEISLEFSGSYQWGETVGQTSEVDMVYDVAMPEKSNVAVGVVATRGTCDVPFSYTQHDTMYDGKEVVCVMDDGLYRGMNTYCVKFESKQDKIPDY